MRRRPTPRWKAADYVTTHLRELSGASEEAPDRPAKLQAFCRQFVERAFRQPLSPENEQRYVTTQFQVGRDLEWRSGARCC